VPARGVQKHHNPQPQATSRFSAGQRHPNLPSPPRDPLWCVGK
jgi:hypothetical protein